MRLIIILCIFLLLVIGCQSKEDNFIIKEVSSDLFTLRVEVERVKKSKIKIHTELVYAGDNSIQIMHTDPMVVAVVGDRLNRPGMVISFVGIQKTLSKNEVYSYDKDNIINLKPEDSILYAQSVFTIESEEKKINLDSEINLDEVN